MDDKQPPNYVSEPASRNMVIPDEDRVRVMIQEELQKKSYGPIFTRHQEEEVNRLARAVFEQEANSPEMTVYFQELVGKVLAKRGLPSYETVKDMVEEEVLLSNSRQRPGLGQSAFPEKPHVVLNVGSDLLRVQNRIYNLLWLIFILLGIAVLIAIPPFPRG